MDNQILRPGVRDSDNIGETPSTVVHLDTLQGPPNPGAPPGQPEPVQQMTPPPVIEAPPLNPLFSQPTQYTSTTSSLPNIPPAKRKPKARLIGAILLGVLIVLGLLAIIVQRLVQHNVKPMTSVSSAQNFGPLNIPLAGINSAGAITEGARALSVNGQLRVNGSLIVTPAAQPPQPATGQLYFDQTSNHLSYFDGSKFVQLQTSQDAKSNSNTTNTTNVTNATNNSSVNAITNLSVTNVTNNTSNVTNNSSTNVTTSNPIGGTQGTIAEFTSGQTLGNSILTDNTTFLGVNGGINITAASSTTNLSFWTPSSAPAHFDNTDIGGSLELGVKFQVDVPGTIQSIRFYKATTVNTTPITVGLWTSTGTLLAQATATVSGTGWQQINLPAPVSISPQTTYVASYFITSAPGAIIGYPFDTQTFGSGGIDNGPLHALASGLDGGNGVFKYTNSAAFPTQTFNSTNYWVDVVFAGSQFTNNSRIRVNNAQLSSSDLANDTNLAKRGSAQVFSAHNIFRNASDSVDEFSIQSANTTEMFSADSLDNRIYIGSGGNTLLVLNNYGGTGDPPNSAEGAMYYQAVNKIFRCFHDGAWANCSDPQPDRSYSMYDEFMSGETGALSQNGPIGSLPWTAQNIGGVGNISFNPTTPTPVADRPGVLALQSPAVGNQGSTLSLATSSGGSMILEPNVTMKTSVAVGSATNSVLRIGLHNETTTTTQPVSGVWWEANPSANVNWQYCYGDGTTATCASSGVAITANSWVRLAITTGKLGTGTSAATFTINGNPFSVGSVTIDSTNRISPAFTCYTTTGSAQNFYWDYFQLMGLTSAVR